MRLQDKLDHLFSLRREGGGDLSIRADFFTLLDRLGNPHLRLPPTIHVAGTNGKGSTVAFMRAMLEQAGYSVHVYTSPHLVRYNERFVIAGEIVSDALLNSLLDEVLHYCEGLAQSFFEITPALAFLAFARFPADVVLLETGLGGRLDHTNIIPAPLASVITTLSYDHTHLLGDTIEQIAGEKAGIMKRGSPCIIGHQIYPAVFAVLKDHANQIQCPLVTEDQWPRLDTPPAPNLVGPHQIQNAALAVATLLTQTRFAIPETAMRQGLQTAHWPARLQRIETIPLSPDWELWLDGGHNDSAGLVLANQAEIWADTDPKPLHIITGMLGHKEAASFARALVPYAASVTTIAIPGHETASTPPAQLATIWTVEGAQTICAADAHWKTLLPALMQTAPAGRILLTGSLYLAESALAIQD